MGYGINYQCRICREKFSRGVGPTMLGGGVYFCEDCGLETSFDDIGHLARLEQTPCQCGGRLSADALPLCPKCGSRDLESEIWALMD